MRKLLIKNGTVVTFQGNQFLSKNTDILIEGQKIKKIKESIPSQEADSIIDA
ncbi:hypothetical protein IIU_05959, partial [Bacillus cereus VD133]